LESQEVPPRVADAVVWLSEALVPQVTYAMFRQASNDRDQSLIDNTHLMRLRIDLSRRLPRLGAVLGRVMIQADLGAPRSPLPLAGCYLAATGTDSQERAFGPGVLRRLIEGQNAVRWTDAARREESHYDLVTLLGYALSVLLFITSLGLVWWLYRSW
jgi:hypothetical protein